MTLGLYYKGLSAEERIFAQSPSESARLAKGTLYEAWFDTLQTSPWYEEIARTGNFPSRDAKTTWQHFGDLRDKSFSTWWLETGYKIFAEEIPYRRLEIEDLNIELVQSAKRPPMLKIEVPLNLSPAELQRQLGEILRGHEAYSSDEYDRWRHSTAAFHQYRETRITFQSIQRWLQMYKQYEALRQSEDITQAEFALRFKLVPGFKAVASEIKLAVEERQRLSNATSDILKSARNLMAHATEGLFPTTDSHPFVRGKPKE